MKSNFIVEISRKGDNNYFTVEIDRFSEINKGDILIVNIGNNRVEEVVANGTIHSIPEHIFNVHYTGLHKVSLIKVVSQYNNLNVHSHANNPFDVHNNQTESQFGAPHSHSGFANPVNSTMNTNSQNINNVFETSNQQVETYKVEEEKLEETTELDNNNNNNSEENIEQNFDLESLENKLNNFIEENNKRHEQRDDEVTYLKDRLNTSISKIESLLERLEEDNHSSKLTELNSKFNDFRVECVEEFDKISNLITNINVSQQESNEEPVSTIVEKEDNVNNYNTSHRENMSNAFSSIFEEAKALTDDEFNKENTEEESDLSSDTSWFDKSSEDNNLKQTQEEVIEDVNNSDEENIEPEQNDLLNRFENFFDKSKSSVDVIENKSTEPISATENSVDQLLTGQTDRKKDNFKQSEDDKQEIIESLAHVLETSTTEEVKEDINTNVVEYTESEVLDNFINNSSGLSESTDVVEENQNKEITSAIENTIISNDFIPFEDNSVTPVDTEDSTNEELTENTVQTSSEVIEISTEEQFINMESNPSGNYILMNDLYFEGKTFKPMFKDVPFSGTLDGNGFSIIGVTIAAENYLVKQTAIIITNNGTIKNLQINKLRYSLEGLSDLELAGICITNNGIISDVICSTFIRATSIKKGVNCSSIAINNYGTIERVSAHGSLEIRGNEAYLGGITCSNFGEISNCFCDSSLKATHYPTIGGVSAINEGNISNCLILATFKSRSENPDVTFIGGITARQNNGYISECIVLSDFGLDCKKPTVGVGVAVLESATSCSIYTKKEAVVFNNSKKTKPIDIKNKTYILKPEKVFRQDSLYNKVINWPEEYWNLSGLNNKAYPTLKNKTTNAVNPKTRTKL